ncbi:MAG TPA: hypothetical protein VM123_16595 [archaeon]|nr:hypothetical protein [archaeon]
MSSAKKAKKAREWPVAKIALAYLLLILTVVVLSSLFFPVRVWGLSLLKGFPLYVWVIFAAFSLIGVIPRLRKKVAGLLDPSGREVSPGAGILRRFTFPIALGASIAAILFLVRCPIMGDGIDHIYNFLFHQETSRHYPFFSAMMSGLYAWTDFLAGEKRAAGPITKEMSFFIWSLVTGLGAGMFTAGLLKLTPLLDRKTGNSLLPAAFVITSGTMALFSGFIEVTVLFNALLVVYILAAVHALEENSAPWPPFVIFFICLGLHASAAALLPSLVWLVFTRREEIRTRPLPWILAIVVPGGLFLGAVFQLMDLKAFLLQFVTGVETLNADSSFEQPFFAYGLFTSTHLLELTNVLLLHNPLNLLMLAWTAYAVIVYRKNVLSDNISMILLLALCSFLVELSLLNAYLGAFRDWDIFSPPGILLPLTAFRIWQVSAPGPAKPALSKAAAVLLPLALAHLVLWEITLHSPDRIASRMVSYVRDGKFLPPRGMQFLGSHLSIYCVEEDYFPEHIIDFLGRDEESRKFVIYRLCKINRLDKALELTEKWPEALSLLDYANIGIALTADGLVEQSIYYLRLGYNKDPYDGPIVRNMATCYLFSKRPAASYFYYLQLPGDRREKFKEKYSVQWKYEPESDEEALKLQNQILPEAALDIYNNGMECLNKGFFPGGEQELLASIVLGLDSLNVYQELGRAALKEQKWDKAQHYFGKLVRISPGNWRYLAGLGMAYAYSGKKAEASKIVELLAGLGVSANLVKNLKAVIDSR